uniref:CSON004162 protein n=1 Tax=Culicoides sonorensis TaxID=179676 RepID=A0A336L4P4_CULSO
MEITTFLGAAFAFIALGLVFFLYINRKWCFKPPKGSFSNCDESLLASTKTLHNFKSRLPFHENTSSDSEEEILRRLKLAQSHNAQQFHQQQQQQQSLSGGRYNGTGLTHNLTNYSGLQNITLATKDALDNVEQSKCSSKKSSKHKDRSHNHHHHHRRHSDKHNDPLGLAERGRIGIPHSSSDCSSNSSSKHHEDRDDKSSRRNSSSGSSNRYVKTGPLHQDSLDDVPDINSNNQDCIVVLSQEPLFDTSDLKSLKSEFSARPFSPTSQRGTDCALQIALFYDAPIRKMTVHVLQARGIPLRESQQIHTQVRLLMLPTKKQKHKTRIRPGENPQFMESFLLHRVNPEEVNSMGLRVRLYGCERMRRERLIGESIVSFASIDLELETNLWLPLEPKGNGSLCGSSSDLLSLARSDSTGSTTSMQHGGVPELLLGLGYNGLTGRLSVEIVKGSHFRNVSLSKAPDTYVKACLVSSMGQEMAKAKSSTRRGQPNPLFKETFIFQVALFQLNDVTLIISVYAKRNMKRNEMVGWFSLGLNASGPEEVAHWNDMRESSSTRTELISRWHVLVDS